MVRKKQYYSSMASSHTAPMAAPPNRAASHGDIRSRRRGGAPVGPGIILGNADGLVHHLLGGDPSAAHGCVVAHNENGLFKNMRVRGIHHDDPAGKSFYQELCPPLLRFRLTASVCPPHRGIYPLTPAFFRRRTGAAPARRSRPPAPCGPGTPPGSATPGRWRPGRSTRPADFAATHRFRASAMPSETITKKLPAVSCKRVHSGASRTACSPAGRDWPV